MPGAILEKDALAWLPMRVHENSPFAEAHGVRLSLAVGGGIAVFSVCFRDGNFFSTI